MGGDGGEERNNGKYREKEVYKSKKVQRSDYMLCAWNEERRRGDCSPVSESLIRS